MKNKKIRQMTILAMFIAIMTIMTFVPQIGFIAITPVVAFTLLHIPVLVGAYLFGWKYGAILGLAFGLLSFFRALVWPIGILDPFFVNPLISVLPRIIFGLVSGLVFEFIKKLNQKPVGAIFLAISSFVLTFFHSAIVLLTLGLFNGVAIIELAAFSTYASYWLLMGAIIITNGLSEAVIAAIIVPLLVYSLKKAYRIEENAFQEGMVHTRSLVVQRMILVGVSVLIMGTIFTTLFAWDLMPFSGLNVIFGGPAIIFRGTIFEDFYNLSFNTVLFFSYIILPLGACSVLIFLKGEKSVLLASIMLLLGGLLFMSSKPNFISLNGFDAIPELISTGFGIIAAIVLTLAGASFGFFTIFTNKAAQK